MLKYRSAIAVVQPEKTIFGELNSRKKSDFGPANQNDTNIPNKYFPGNKVLKKTISSRILLICRVITMVASEKPNIDADSKIAKNTNKIKT